MAPLQSARRLTLTISFLYKDQRDSAFQIECDYLPPPAQAHAQPAQAHAQAQAQLLPPLLLLL